MGTLPANAKPPSGKYATDRACAVTIADLACVRGGRVLFSGLSLSLGAGEACHVMGANGVGKSSFIRVLAGLLPTSSGACTLVGRIALADERLALDPDIAVRDALAHWARLDGASDEMVDGALAATGLDKLAFVPVRIFSTGQRKRAVLARVVASGADIWLLDEPANGLDSASLARLGAAMAAHRARGGMIIAASHQPLPLDDPMTLDLARFAP